MTTRIWDKISYSVILLQYYGRHHGILRHFSRHRLRVPSRGADADPLGAVLVLTETSLTSQYRITDDDACLTAAWRELMQWCCLNYKRGAEQQLRHAALAGFLEFVTVVSEALRYSHGTSAQCEQLSHHFSLSDAVFRVSPGSCCGIWLLENLFIKKINRSP